MKYSSFCPVRLLIALLCLFAPRPLPALESAAVAAPSLFFNQKELDQIENPVSQTASQTTAQDERITLGAIVYFGPGNWTIWLQNERFTPLMKHPRLQILSVTPNAVRFAYTPPQDGAPVKESTLHPYQTFDPATGKITGETGSSPKANP